MGTDISDAAQDRPSSQESEVGLRKQWRQRQKSLSVFQPYLSHPQLLCCSGASDTLLFASNKYSLLSENDQQQP